MNTAIQVAICYDFDGTLIRGNMQENSFIPELQMDKKEFWDAVGREAKKQDMDEVLAYMELMMSAARAREKPFNRQHLQKHGESVRLFPGVEEWFDLINTFGQELDLCIKHYVISSGIDEMIKGSPIGERFDYIFASGFAYDANDVPKFAARSVNYTTKTQYLFRINKGILNSWDNAVNRVMEEAKRPIPFTRMIYLGDGDTDIPAMKMLNYQGGYSIVVYPPKRENNNEEIKQKEANAKRLYVEDRAQFVAEADYRRGSGLFKLVSVLLRRIADEAHFGMNKKA